MNFCCLEVIGLLVAIILVAILAEGIGALIVIILSLLGLGASAVLPHEKKDDDNDEQSCE